MVNKLTPTLPKYGHGKGCVIGSGNFFKRNEYAHIRLGGHLPHWEQDGVVQFVTFRLNDSLPQIKLNEFELIRQEWLSDHPKPWTIDEFFEFEDLEEIIEEWLDAGYGECWLKYEEVQNIVVECLDHYDGERYDLYDFIIMPNHIHLLIIPGSGYTLKEIIQSLKGFTAYRINKLIQRKGKLWQREYFDRMIRNINDFNEKQEYIKHNPDFIKKGL